MELEIRANDGKEKLGSAFSDAHVSSILSDCGLSREKEMYWLQLMGNKCFPLSNLDTSTTIVRNECLYL